MNASKVPCGVHPLNKGLGKDLVVSQARGCGYTDETLSVKYSFSGSGFFRKKTGAMKCELCSTSL